LDGDDIATRYCLGWFKQFLPPDLGGIAAKRARLERPPDGEQEHRHQDGGPRLGPGGVSTQPEDQGDISPNDEQRRDANSEGMEVVKALGGRLVFRGVGREAHASST
jgi:hypothetical protein